MEAGCKCTNYFGTFQIFVKKNVGRGVGAVGQKEKRVGKNRQGHKPDGHDTMQPAEYGSAWP